MVMPHTDHTFYLTKQNNMFKNCKNGDILYVIEVDAKNGSPSYFPSPILNISSIRTTPVQNAYSSSMPNMNNTIKECDIMVEIDGKQRQFTNINPESDYFVGGSFRVSTEKQKIANNIKMMYDENITYINNMDKYQKIIDDCESILKDIGFVEQSTANDIRFKNFDNRLSAMEDKTDKMINMMEKLSISFNMMQQSQTPQADDKAIIEQKTPVTNKRTKE